MAERRMFAKPIIGSGRFIKMPPSSRLLYYDLGMYADDEGVVEAFTVMRQTGATEDDLRVLVTKGFVKILNDELVTVITDWKVNNFIRTDRYKDSAYHDLLVQMNTDNNQLDTIGIPDDNQRYTQVRLGKVRLGKSNKKPSVSTIAYGEYRHIRLTKEQHDKLLEEWGEEKLDFYIRHVDEYCERCGKRYKNYNSALRTAERDGWGNYKGTVKSADSSSLDYSDWSR